MTKWTEGGVALPSRSDVPTPTGKDVLAGQAQFAKPGSGFMKNYARRPEGVPGRLHEGDPGQDLQRRRGDRGDEGRRRHRARRASQHRPTRGRRRAAGGAARALTREDRAWRSRAARDPRAPTGIGRRSEGLAGYAFIAIPMLLFLVLNIGSILYAIFISVFQWNIRSGAGQFIGIANYQNVFKDPIFIRAIQNSLYYAVVWVPLTMAVGLFLAVLVNQKLRGRTFFRAAFYFPAIASSAAITILWIFLAAPDGLFNGVRGALGLNPIFQLLGLHAQPELDGQRQHRAELGDPPQRLDDVRDVHALLPRLAPDDQRRGLRGGGDRRRGHVADVLEDHVPAAKPGHYFVATVAVIGALQLFDQARSRAGRPAIRRMR